LDLVALDRTKPLTVIRGAAYVRAVLPEPPVRSAPSAPCELHAHAMDNLRFIRETMENAGSFTAVSGWGQAAIGVSALAAAAIASQQTAPGAWLAVWVVEAAVALAIGAFGIVSKARRTGLSFSSAPGRKAAICFAPPLACGGLLTPVIYRSSGTALLPGTWLLLFGVAVVTGGAMSVKIVPLMGLVLMAIGAAALFAPPAWGDAFMAAGFGAVLIGFGVVIARRHGG